LKELLRTGEGVLPRVSDQVKISIKKPDGTVITIDLPQERDISDILHVVKGVLGVSGQDNLPTNRKEQGSTPLGTHTASPIEGLDELSIMDKLKILVKNAIPLLWFSSQELQELYQHYFGDVPITTVSTYLARLVENDFLERRGPRRKRRYKLLEGTLDATPEIDLNEISMVKALK